jgi:hypothetical protein
MLAEETVQRGEYRVCNVSTSLQLLSSTQVFSLELFGLSNVDILEDLDFIPSLS